jgi:hypothetical protein
MRKRILIALEKTVMDKFAEQEIAGGKNLRFLGPENSSQVPRNMNNHDL